MKEVRCDMANPNPALIPDVLWDFWTIFDGYDAEHILTTDVALGGIYADKKGYHNTVTANKERWPGNYSYAAWPALDDVPPRDKARAVDLTFRDAQAGQYGTIIKYTRLLVDADQRRDFRLYRAGQPILREVLGTLDGVTTIAWDLHTHTVRYRPDLSHLWHIHLSWHTASVNDPVAARQILALLMEVPMARTLTDDDLKAVQAALLAATIVNPLTTKPAPVADYFTSVNTNAYRARVAAEELAGRSVVDDSDEAAIIAGVLAGLGPAAIAAAVVDALPPTTAQKVIDELVARLNAATTPA